VGIVIGLCGSILVDSHGDPPLVTHYGFLHTSGRPLVIGMRNTCPILHPCAQHTTSARPSHHTPSPPALPPPQHTYTRLAHPPCAVPCQLSAPHPPAVCLSDPTTPRQLPYALFTLMVSAQTFLAALIGLHPSTSAGRPHPPPGDPSPPPLPCRPTSRSLVRRVLLKQSQLASVLPTDGLS
jgi:hypothetical protein